ncbi:TRAP transporter substrate-binding protein DctP [Microbaculum marinisediminis]|uniref:TRAP transporter substrate-binding protein DctP n=1 Tax=Microbaculum marinisediminis TaxID=2931392 RepID=A0AAW5R2S4_9HYPH|nr:TRAP transporter substrate-binding protein DctP [Microbaculum sp. A6E488]MCT8974139.1 TRAP transporter substrate-binding protein DctP [Microbaculum sp. A6E488]
MRGLRQTIRSLTAASVVLAGVAGAQAEEIVLKALTYAPPSKVEDSMAVFKAWIDKVNAKGEGKLRVEILGGPEVFGVGDQVNAVSKGLADITLTFTAHTALVPEVDTLGLSGITVAEERENGYLALLDEAHSKINLKVIGRAATQSGFFIFSKEPIESLADFEGMKIRSHSGYDGFFRKLNANPIGMNISEIYGGLERGIVTAAPYNIFAYDLGLHEVTDYMLADPFWYSHTTVTLMNRKKFDSLPAELQAVLIDAQIEIEAEMADIVAKMAEEERKRLAEAGMTFTNLPPEEAEQFRQMATESRFEVLEEILGADRVAEIKALIVRQ